MIITNRDAFSLGLSDGFLEIDDAEAEGTLDSFPFTTDAAVNAGAHEVRGCTTAALKSAYYRGYERAMDWGKADLEARNGGSK